MKNLTETPALKLVNNMDAIVTTAALEDFVQSNVVFITDNDNAIFVSVEDDNRWNRLIVKFTTRKTDCLDCADATDDLSSLTSDACELHTQVEHVSYEFVPVYQYA